MLTLASGAQAAATLSGSYTSQSCTKGCVATTDTWGSCSGSVAAKPAGGSETVTNTVTGYTGSETATCNASGTGAWSYTSSSCTATTCSSPCGTIANGATCTAYLDDNPTGACTSQTRTCTNGTLSGTYTYASCAAGCSTPCGAKASGGTCVAYADDNPAGACTSQTRTCTNGTLSGSYTYASCTKGCVATTAAWSNCSGSVAARAAGGTETVTNTASGYSGSETATCNASGTGAFAYSAASCTATNCAVPSAWQSACGGSTIASGGSCYGYTASSGIISACDPDLATNCDHKSITISCSNGTLSGSTTASTVYASCVNNCPSCSCFLPDVVITLADGSTKRVGELQIGDAVMGHTRTNYVLRVPTKNVTTPIYGFNGGTPFVTGGHPFWTTNGWKAIDPALTPTEHHGIRTTKLQVGDVLLRDDGSKLVINSIDAPDPVAEHEVYNPAVDGDHTYYANGILVHNKQVNPCQ